MPPGTPNRVVREGKDKVDDEAGLHVGQLRQPVYRFHAELGQNTKFAEVGAEKLVSYGQQL